MYEYNDIPQNGSDPDEQSSNFPHEEDFGPDPLLDEMEREFQAVTDADGEPRTDGGVTQSDSDDAAALARSDELTRFKFDILGVLAGGADYGLGIKKSLEANYGSEVNHGRLYPNLDTLIETGLVKKSELDRRTNEYALTAKGERVYRQRVVTGIEQVGTDFSSKEIDRIWNALDASDEGGDGQ